MVSEDCSCQRSFRRPAETARHFLQSLGGRAHGIRRPPAIADASLQRAADQRQGHRRRQGRHE